MRSLSFLTTRIAPFVLACSACTPRAGTPSPPSPASPVPITSADTTSAANARFTWPVPPKWKEEKIPFPLDFAPALPYRGVEELRFAPGFFDPAAPGFWSYAFVWWIDSGPVVTETSLRDHLQEYFVGLTSAVAKDHFEVDTSKIRVDALRMTGERFEGSIRTIDAFKTRREIALTTHGVVSSCAGHRYVLVSASPRPAGDPIWSDLEAVTAGFHCETSSPPQPR
jgi:hypothetical protein